MVREQVPYLITPVTPHYFYKGQPIEYFNQSYHDLVKEPLEYFTATNKNDGQDVKLCMHPRATDLPRGVSYEKVLSTLSSGKSLPSIEPEASFCTIM